MPSTRHSKPTDRHKLKKYLSNAPAFGFFHKEADNITLNAFIPISFTDIYIRNIRTPPRRIVGRRKLFGKTDGAAAAFLSVGFCNKRHMRAIGYMLAIIASYGYEQTRFRLNAINISNSLDSPPHQCREHRYCFQYQHWKPPLVIIRVLHDNTIDFRTTFFIISLFVNEFYSLMVLTKRLRNFMKCVFRAIMCSIAGKCVSSRKKIKMSI